MRIVNNVCKGKMSYVSILIALLYFFFKENLETSLPGDKEGILRPMEMLRGKGI